MLPSTGYFKGINCPFYDSGLCERPFCHFRHSKNSQNIATEGLDNDSFLQKLVTQAVKKVLENTDGAASSTQAENAIKQSFVDTGYMPVPGKVKYNPTPISQLNKGSTPSDTTKDDDVCDEPPKRHIPVPYSPFRPTPNPTKRPMINENKNTKPFIYNPPEVDYIAGCNVKHDIYCPKSDTEIDLYKPGTGDKTQPAYEPDISNNKSNHNYIPSGKSDRTGHKKTLLEYRPKAVGASKNENKTLKYRPTPLSEVPCFSSDEEEPEVKKSKTNESFDNLDDLDSDFEILGQILDEEKSKETPKAGAGESSNINCFKSVISSSPKPIQRIDHYSDLRDEDKRDIDKFKSNYDQINSTKEEVDSMDSKNKSIEIKSDSLVDTSKQEIKTNRKDLGKVKESANNSEKSVSKKSKSKSREKSTKYKERRDSSRSRDKTLKKERYRHKSEISTNHKHKSKSSEKDREHLKERDSEHPKFSKDASSHSNHSISNSSMSSKHSGSRKRAENPERFIDSSINTKNMSDDDIQAETLTENELIEELSESDDEQIELECKKIFEEYVPTAKIIEDEIPEKQDEAYYIPTKKRISHTSDNHIKMQPKPVAKPDYKLKAAQAMAERLEKVKEYHSSKSLAACPLSSKGSLSNIPSPAILKSVTFSSSSKIRIAHVPNVSTLLNAKKIIPPKNSLPVAPSTSTTVQTIAKGSSRVAHIPNDKFADRPGVLEPLGSKIPANLRSTYLNMMIDQCLKIYMTPTDAYARAQQEELNTSKKCSKVAVYKNSAVLTVNRLKKEFEQCRGIKKSASECEALQKISHDKILLGRAGFSTSWSVEVKNKTVDFSNEFLGIKFYENISQWVLTEEQLRDNGFPRPHPDGEKGKAIIYVQNNKHKPPKGFLRTCCRCKKDYTVDKKGLPIIKEECIYHPNNKYRVRGEVRYQCCGQDGMSDGCSSAPCHVFEYVDYENLRGYVRTMPKNNTGDHGVFALDCEMCYTTHGLDLTRVTVINSSCKKVYETLIKPLHPIIDYNTRFSGITEEQMEGVTTTLIEVQATLLTMFSNKTILIGHSLESDFKVLKLIHDTVVDTSVLFPHKMGPPYKRALRNLSSEHLRKIIQNSVDGHDSAEDATVCMELVHFKLKEELKVR